MRIDHRNNTNVIMQLRYKFRASSINPRYTISGIAYISKQKIKRSEKKYEVDVRNSATCGICTTVVKIRSDSSL